MKFRFNISLFLLLLSFAACDPLKAPKVEEQTRDLKGIESAIHKVMDDQTDAWNAGSIDGFMKGYWHSDSLKFITKRGVRYGYDSVASRYKRSYDTREKMGILTFKNLVFSSLDKDDEIINVTGEWQVKQKEKLDSGLFSLIFREVKSDWKIIIDHTW